MADPNWKPAYDCHVSWGATPIPTISNEFTHTSAEFDTTNDLGGGYTDFGLAEQTFSLRFSSPYDSANPVVPTVRDLLAATWTDGVITYTGKGRITSVARRGGGKGGYTRDYTAKLAGNVSTGGVSG